MGGIFIYQLYKMIALFITFPADISTVISIEQQVETVIVSDIDLLISDLSRCDNL